MSIRIELERKAEKYHSLTELALKKVSIIADSGTREHEIARDFLEMAQNYYEDGCYFQEKGDLLTALASFSYVYIMHLPA